MKTKKKCEICSKRFEAVRSDAKYCSGACKQKAYSIKHSASTTSTQPKPIFQFSEYQRILEECGYESDNFSLIFYCFLRRNFPQNTTLENVIAYINSVWTYDNYKELTTSKAFTTFKEEFLNNEYCIS